MLFDEIAQIMRDRDEMWRAQAACLGQDIRLFFPDPSLRPGQSGYDTSELTAEARALCAVCPVSRECDAYAERTGSAGLFGGRWHDHKWIRQPSKGIAV